MNFHNFVRKYVFFFFILGQSPRYPNNITIKSPTKKPFQLSKFIVHIPSMLYSVFLVMALFDYFYFTLNEKVFGLYALFIWNKFATSIAVLKNSPLVPNTLPKVWHTFEDLERLTIRHFQFEWQYGRHEKRILATFVTITVLNVFRISSKYFFGEDGSIFTAFLNGSMIFVAYTVALHILFYLEMMNFAMKTVNKHLSKSQNNGIKLNPFKLDWNGQKLYVDIEMYKSVHYQLYKLCKLINENFGWIFECYFLQVFGNMLNLFTVIVIDIQTGIVTQRFHILSTYFELLLF